MFKRLLALTTQQSCFLFGPRGVGKSTLLKTVFSHSACLWIDLLDPETEARFSRSPQDLLAIVNNPAAKIKHIIIDEIQKIPKLLDVVHLVIEKKLPIQFILTGSSARKLKRGGANLLAGRAFVYHLFSLSFLELEEQFDIQKALEWGLLPKIFEYQSDVERQQFLTAYSNTYLKEEIWNEQFIKNLDPFRRFLEVAAQMNGKILNFSSIARDVGVTDTTVKDYFSILEDTLIGFFLEPFHHSFRKRLSTKPKFYFFDVGVTRSLARMLRVPLQVRTSLYGETFEHFIILECIKLATYGALDYRFSYLSTKDGAEVDLVVDRPGQPHLFIEIKSTTQVTEESLLTLSRLAKDFVDCESVCFSQDRYQKKWGDITVYPWQEGIKQFFLRTE